MRKASPCRGCDHRTIDPNCHDICETFLLWKEEDQREKETLKKARHQEDEQKRISMRRNICVNNGALGRRKK